MEVKPIEQATFDAAGLIGEHPPQWNHPNKRTVYQISSTSGFPFEGQHVYSRWAEQPLPTFVRKQGQFSLRSGVFDYTPPVEPLEVDWYMNFADRHLFFAYSSSLLAQDELQVAEHPILGSVRAALIASDHPPKTVGEDGRPTPITITGAQRRCAIDTRPRPELGLPAGIYGNAFARASQDQVEAVTQPITPPTVSNVLAIAAPAGGYGAYTRDEITYIANAAFTGFSAARRESMRLAGDEAKTVIHTGFWGCGAFGGNRKLMTILQALAADLAEVEIIFWAFNASGRATAEDAYQQYASSTRSIASVSQILDELVQLKFPWGVSNGT
jgi:hypothetical protein